MPSEDAIKPQLQDSELPGEKGVVMPQHTEEMSCAELVDVVPLTSASTEELSPGSSPHNMPTSTLITAGCSSEKQEPELKADVGSSSSLHSSESGSSQDFASTQFTKSQLGGLKDVSAIEEFEAVDLLKRVSKYLNHVEIQPVDINPTIKEVPKSTNFRVPGKPDQTDWIGFAYAYLAAQMEAHCPTSLSSGQPPPISIGQLRAQLERCYVLFPPEFWHHLIEGHLGDIYRWTNPRRTACYVVAYYVLWFFDKIPSFIVAYTLYILIDRRLNPPPVAQVRQEASRRRRLVRQAETLRKEFSRGNHNGSFGRVSEALSSNVTAFASPALGISLNTKAHGFDSGSDPTTDLRKMSDHIGLYSLSRGLYSHYGGPIQNLLQDLGEIGEKIRNLYLWRRPDASRRSCILIMIVLCYTLFLPQWLLVKNLLAYLGFHFFFIFGFNEKYPKFRKVLNPFWLILWDVPTDHEFALQILQARAHVSKPSPNVPQGSKKNPQDSRSSFPQDNIAAQPKDGFTFPPSQSGVPDDCSSYGRLEQTPMSGFSNSSNRPSILSRENLKKWSQGVAAGGTEVYRRAKNRYSGVEKANIDSQMGGTDFDINDSINNSSRTVRTFAILKGPLPGTLTVENDQVWFEPARGFRTKASRSINFTTSKVIDQKAEEAFKLVSASTPYSLDPPDANQLYNTERLDAVNHPSPHGGKLLVISSIDEIVGLKKSKSFGLGILKGDGIEFKLLNSQNIAFEVVARRDDVFQKLLTIIASSRRDLALIPSG